MHSFKCLTKQSYSIGNYSLVPIRAEDRYLIMQWRNEQIYHLRQNKLLKEEDQDTYFQNVISDLFNCEQPDQILFSYLGNAECIGYGGLVHINWPDKNAELSFIMNTSLEKDYFDFHWSNFLSLIEEVAFRELGLHKIYTYAFDLRPQLYKTLENNSFLREAELHEHCFYEGNYLDVVIHSKINRNTYLRDAEFSDVQTTFRWANHDAVRMYSVHKEKIEWESHSNWFKNKLDDRNCEYYILMHNGSPIGSARFDIDMGGVALISYLIDPAYHGKGFGTTILEQSIKRLHIRREKLKRLVGYVMEENLSSIRIFTNLDFQQTGIEYGLRRYEKLL